MSPFGAIFLDFNRESLHTKHGYNFNSGAKSMIDIDKAKLAMNQLNQIRQEIGSSLNYINLNYEDMLVVYGLMKAKQAEKFIEDWVANLIGGKKVNKREAIDKFSKCDLGDIQLGKTVLHVGKNNIELKVNMAMNDIIGGGQFRFFEPIAGYMFFKAISESRYEMFLLSKDQLVNEIKERAQSSGRSAFCSSQGSNDIKGSTEERLVRLDENVRGEKMDKIGWSFNLKTEKEYYESFKYKYLVTPEELKEKYEI